MQTAEQLKQAPEYYADWTVWFRTMKCRNLNRSELELLRLGVCMDLAGSLEYLEKQTAETLEVMLNRCYRLFRKDLTDIEIYNDTGALYTAFQKLAGRFSQCSFFMQMTFLPQEFRTELLDALRKEACSFWEKRITDLRKLCMEEGNSELEDQLYLIRRIRLFRECGSTAK